jgi:hypothetical protein
LEFLVQLATARDAEGTNELFEIDGAILVDVKDLEYVIGEFPWFAKGEELFIYSTELLLVELT